MNDVHGFIFAWVAEYEADVEVKFAPAVGDPAEGGYAKFYDTWQWE